ncbi:MAG: DMT family transporter [Chloroflexi bacterium]|nr:DMT family transporter [Chloroflexota bacterium]
MEGAKRPPASAGSRGGLAYVGLAVFLFSTSPVLIRYAAPLSPFEIAFGRMAVAAISVGAMALFTGRGRLLSGVSAGRFALYGLITSLHFLFYIASLSFTSIAHSLTLVYTAPIFVTVFSALLLREPIPRKKYLGVGVAVAGTAILAGFEPRLTPQMAFGDLLALGSAVTFGLYSVAGRFERGNYPLLQYATLVYGAAALWALPAALAARSPVHPWGPMLAVVAAGVLPLAIGHTLYNASLRRVHATYVNLVSTQEVTGGILLGVLLLGEMPSASALVGAVVTLAGVAMVLTIGERRSERQPTGTP